MTYMTFQIHTNIYLNPWRGADGAVVSAELLTVYGVSVALLAAEEALSIEQEYWIQGWAVAHTAERAAQSGLGRRENRTGDPQVTYWWRCGRGEKGRDRSGDGDGVLGTGGGELRDDDSARSSGVEEVRGGCSSAGKERLLSSALESWTAARVRHNLDSRCTFFVRVLLFHALVKPRLSGTSLPSTELMASSSEEDKKSAITIKQKQQIKQKTQPAGGQHTDLSGKQPKQNTHTRAHWRRTLEQ